MTPLHTTPREAKRLQKNLQGKDKKMIRHYDWQHPLPFGDSKWIDKEDIEPLVKAVDGLLNGIYEFGSPMPEDVEAVETALENLKRDKNK